MVIAAKKPKANEPFLNLEHAGYRDSSFGNQLNLEFGVNISPGNGLNIISSDKQYIPELLILYVPIEKSNDVKYLSHDDETHDESDNDNKKNTINKLQQQDMVTTHKKTMSALLATVVIISVCSAETPTNSPSIYPTLSPTKYCGFGTYFILKHVIGEEREYNDSKYIDNIILNGGESIISQNCVYLFKLQLSGNLILYNINEKMIIWQTNTLLINDYQDTELKSINIKFFFAPNGLWLIEDKFPTIYDIKPYVLWNNDIDDIDDDHNDDHDEEGYKLILQNHGFVLLIDENENIIWKIPKINDTVSRIEINSTIQEIDNSLDDKNENESTFDAGMDLLWLWIILSLFIFFCILYFTVKIIPKKKRNNDLIPVMITLNTNNVNCDDDNSSNNKNEDYVEDEMITNWMNSTNSDVNNGELKTNINKEIELQQMMSNDVNDVDDDSSSSSIMLGGIEGNDDRTNHD